MRWQATMPVNLALIKYMGKLDSTQNRASNPSLSYTLSDLTTTVELTLMDKNCDQWQALNANNIAPLTLSQHSQTRFLNHLNHIKQLFNCKHHFLVSSGSNFPSDCGLASSASSFAALTSAANLACSELTQQSLLSTDQLAQLSRQGSGSSCRSFYAPWCIWDGDCITPIEQIHETHPFYTLLHQVVIVNQTQKTVSSSQAHEYVKTSLLFENRQQRARSRQSALINALIDENWQDCYELTWQDCVDMHALFDTSTPPFRYMTAQSYEIIQKVHHHWQCVDEGPLITLDAGPNVHLLWQTKQRMIANQFQQGLIQDGYCVR